MPKEDYFNKLIVHLLFVSVLVDNLLIIQLRNMYVYKNEGGARGVMVIVVGNGHGDTSSNPGLDWLHFT